MAAYYNEHDPFAAAWLRNLIGAGHIAAGDVDERDVQDVRPEELRGYTQVHLFAGIGGWSHALRLAGWPDDRPVWTASCPCQPFSAAGKGGGFADERHLWPAAFHLIRECRPVRCFGEQVSSRDGLIWWDAVCADLESEGYAAAALDVCAAGIGAPHIRQRLYWVADADGGDASAERQQRGGEFGLHEGGRGYGGLADASRGGRGKYGDVDETLGGGSNAGQSERREPDALGLADAERPGLEEQRVEPARGQCETVERSGEADRPSPLDGFWRDADWLFCRDGKWRPVEPGSFPLAHGVPNRVGRLRGYGNAIVPPLAAQFITATM